MDLKYSMFCGCTHFQSVQVDLMSNPIRRWPSWVHPLTVRCRNSSVQPTARSNVQTALTGGPRREGRWGVSEMCKFLRVGPPLLLLSGYLGGRQRIPSVRGTGRRPSLTEDEFHPPGQVLRRPPPSVGYWSSGRHGWLYRSGWNWFRRGWGRSVIVRETHVRLLRARR